MHKHNLTTIALLIMIGAALDYCPATAQTKVNVEQVGQVIEAQPRNTDWEIFDSSSTISRTAIKVKDIQGIWSAYKGIYRFDGTVNEMELTDPVIFEVRDSAYRRNASKEFKKFILSGNIIIKADETKIDTGIINKITPAELTISWKNKSNYTRYYYKK